MRAMRTALAMAAFALIVPAALADDEKKGDKLDHDRDMTKIETQKHEIKQMAKTSMDELLATSEGAKTLHDAAYGYAVFRVVKVAVGITGGGGEGVAYAKRNMNDPIFMEMATGGIGLGLGGQKYRTIFLFETKEAFDEFVFDGWEADAEANAAAGTEGANAAVSFSNGVAIYQITDKGLLANADVSGTKYWIDEEMNPHMTFDDDDDVDVDVDRERTDD